jgi:CheY-like chemotaxis protein
MSALDPNIILIVDDYEDDAKLLQIMLTNAGILNSTRIALSAEEAITYLKGVPPYSNRAIYPLPSVIFVDLKLPGIDGFELLRWLRGRNELNGSFIVVLSAAGDMVSIQAAYALGANSFLVKPCRAADLENLVLAYPAPWVLTMIPPPSGGPPIDPLAPG